MAPQQSTNLEAGVTEEGAELARTAHRAAVKRLEELGDNLPPTERELLVILVLRVFDPAEPHAPAMPTLRSARRIAAML